MNVIDSIWFSGLDGACIGIVLVKPEFGPPKAYIGNGKSQNQKDDEACIAHYGGKFPAHAANALFHREDIGD